MSLTDEQKANRAKWVEALRSGRYTQTQGALHIYKESPRRNEPVGYCCLGVASVELGVEHHPNPSNNSHYFIYRGAYGKTVIRQGVPDSEWMMRTFGMGYQQVDMLFQMNDSGSTFAEIADEIESMA